MTRVLWSQTGEKFYEDGLDRGVLYPTVGAGVPWNGLISVEEGFVGGEVESYYFDGNKYLDIAANEDFRATLTAFSAPKAFDGCDGVREIAPGITITHQPRKQFGLSYRTGLGNDLEGDGYGYKLHLVYNATASPTTRSMKTRGSDPEATQLSWTIDTVPPVPVLPTFKPTAHFIINSRRVDPAVLQDLEDYLYGSSAKQPSLPSQELVISILSNVITEPLGQFI